MAAQKEFTTLQKRNFKLLAVDVDGTLITSGQIVTNRTLRAINRVKDLGIKVTIATGRHYPSVIRLARKIRINAPLVCCDGAIITDIHTGEAAYHLLPQEVAAEIVKMTLDYDSFTVQVFIKDGKIYGGQNYQGKYIKKFFSIPMKYSLKGYLNLLRDFAFIPVKNLGSAQAVISALKEPVAKVFISGNDRPEDLEDFKKKIEAKFGKEITVTSSMPNTIDVLNGGVSKAKGLLKLAESLGISPDEIITVGDNYNDLEMIKFAGLGVAMGNAPEQVRREADYVTETNDNEGLAEFLEKLILFTEKTYNFRSPKRHSAAMAGKLHQDA